MIFRDVLKGKLMLLTVTILLHSSVNAGQVVVRKSSEPFNAFAVRDQVLLENEWQEALRMQQQIQILQALPAACTPFARPYIYYRCGGAFYRPYHYQNKALYIQVDDIKQTPIHRGKVE